MKKMLRLAMATIIALTLNSLNVNAQTSLKPIADCGSVKTWSIVSGKMPVGTAITVEKPDDKADILFYPTAEQLKGYSLVFTGTYSNAKDSICGEAMNDLTDVGVSDDKFKPNGYISIMGDKTLSLNTSQDGDKSIQVYMPLISSEIDTAVMKNLSTKPIVWKFLVEKQWTKMLSDTTKGKESGYDYAVITFNPMTMGQALKILQGWGRAELKTKAFTYTSKITAAVIPSAAYTGMILNGQQVAGTFRQKQSNVIVIK